MILDKDLIFTKNSSGVPTPQSVASATTATSGVIDLGAEVNPLGGHELTLYVTGNAVASVTGSPTVQVKWETADNSSFTSAAEIAITPALVVTAKGGVMYRMKIMDGVKRYNRVKIVVTVPSGAAATGKTVEVFLTKEQ